MAEFISQQRHGSSRRHLQVRQNVKHKCYPVAFKREICRLCASFPCMKLDEIIQKVKQETGPDVPKTTTFRALKEKDSWYTAKSLGRCRLRDGKFSELERDFMTWSSGFLRLHGTLTYALMKQQAEVFAKQKNIPVADFKTSNGSCTST